CADGTGTCQPGIPSTSARACRNLRGVTIAVGHVAPQHTSRSNTAGMSAHRRHTATLQLVLQDSAEHYRTLYECTPAMLHSIDAEGRLVSVSDLWLSTLGYTREEVIGRPSVDFLTPASREFA